MFLSCVQEAEKLNLPVNGIQAAITDDDYYVYFRGNVIGWEANASTIMTQASTNVWESTFAVTESWMVGNGQNLSFTLTNQLNGWGSGSVTAGDPTYTWPGADVPVSGTATTSSSSVLVKFPALGTYKALFNAVTYSYLISDDLNASLPDEGSATTTLSITTTTLNGLIPYLFSNFTGWEFNSQTIMSPSSGNDYVISINIDSYWEPKQLRFYFHDSPTWGSQLQFFDASHSTSATAGQFDATNPYTAIASPFDASTSVGDGDTWFFFPQAGSYAIYFNRATLDYRIESVFDGNTTKRIPFIRSNLTSWNFGNGSRMEEIEPGIFHKRVSVLESWQTTQNLKLHKNYFNGDWSTEPVHYVIPDHGDDASAFELNQREIAEFTNTETDTYVNFEAVGDYDIFWVEGCDEILISPAQDPIQYERNLTLNLQFDFSSISTCAEPVTLKVGNGSVTYLETVKTATELDQGIAIPLNPSLVENNLIVELSSCSFDENFVIDISDTSKCQYNLNQPIIINSNGNKCVGFSLTVINLESEPVESVNIEIKQLSNTVFSGTSNASGRLDLTLQVDDSTDTIFIFGEKLGDYAQKKIVIENDQCFYEETITIVTGIEETMPTGNPAYPIAYKCTMDNPFNDSTPDLVMLTPETCNIAEILVEKFKQKKNISEVQSSVYVGNLSQACTIDISGNRQFFSDLITPSMIEMYWKYHYWSEMFAYKGINPQTGKEFELIGDGVQFKDSAFNTPWTAYGCTGFAPAMPVLPKNNGGIDDQVFDFDIFNHGKTIYTKPSNSNYLRYYDDTDMNGIPDVNPTIPGGTWNEIIANSIHGENWNLVTAIAMAALGLEFQVTKAPRTLRRIERLVEGLRFLDYLEGANVDGYIQRSPYNCNGKYDRSDVDRFYPSFTESDLCLGDSQQVTRDEYWGLLFGYYSLIKSLEKTSVFDSVSINKVNSIIQKAKEHLLLIHNYLFGNTFSYLPGTITVSLASIPVILFAGPEAALITALILTTETHSILKFFSDADGNPPEMTPWYWVGKEVRSDIFGRIGWGFPWIPGVADLLVESDKFLVFLVNEIFYETLNDYDPGNTVGKADTYAVPQYVFSYYLGDYVDSYPYYIFDHESIEQQNNPFPALAMMHKYSNWDINRSDFQKFKTPFFELRETMVYSLPHGNNNSCSAKSGWCSWLTTDRMFGSYGTGYPLPGDPITNCPANNFGRVNSGVSYLIHFAYVLNMAGPGVYANVMATYDDYFNNVTDRVPTLQYFDFCAAADVLRWLNLSDWGTVLQYNIKARSKTDPNLPLTITVQGNNVNKTFTNVGELQSVGDLVFFNDAGHPDGGDFINKFFPYFHSLNGSNLIVTLNDGINTETVSLRVGNIEFDSYDITFQSLNNDIIPDHWMNVTEQVDICIQQVCP